LKEAATILALRYKLVTPASGAAILDAPKQLYSTDLEPLRAFASTEVAEPDLSGLFFLVFIFFVWFIYMKVRKTNVVIYTT
jgi:hypothetical protein